MNTHQGIAPALVRRVKDRLMNLFLQTLRSNAGRVFEHKYRTFEQSSLFRSEDFSRHFAHIELSEVALQHVVQGFIIDRLRFIQNSLPEESIESDSFIDIGDPSGIFIRGLGKAGLCANISEMAVSATHRKGLETIRCDAEHLPFKDNSIDHILYFEIFEHLPNPISALQELYRVANRSVFLSIPCMTTTNIHKSGYNPDWPTYEHHVFEFDDNDFRKIVSHTGFSIRDHLVAEVIDNGTIKERAVFMLWHIADALRGDPEYANNSRDLYMGCFRKFSVYHLVKDSNTTVSGR